LVNDDEYYCLKADIKEEMQKYGEVVQIRVPRRVDPEINEDIKPAPPGTGRVYVQFKEEEQSRRVSYICCMRRVCLH
jgi:hypothetical protein